MALKQTKSRGFTIVELLIVIIVIAILAAITIVAYNGVQNRAHTSAQKSAANTLAKKLEAFHAVTGAYPVFNTAGTITTQLNAATAPTEANLTGSGITIAYTAPAAGMADGTLQVRLCGSTAPASGATATGYQIWGWDGTLATPAAAMYASGGTTTACSTSTSGS